LWEVLARTGLAIIFALIALGIVVLLLVVLLSH